MQEYINHFCEKNNISLKELRKDIRKRHIVQLRHVLCYNLCEVLEYGISDVGRALNHNHATVLYGIKKIKLEKDIYPDIKELLDKNKVGYIF